MSSDIHPTPTIIAEMADDYCRRVRGPDFESYIPAIMLKSLKGYFNDRLPAGGFLASVLQNNLLGAVTYADDECLFALPAIMAWIALHGNSKAWGSEEHVKEWLEKEPWQV